MRVGKFIGYLLAVIMILSALTVVFTGCAVDDSSLTDGKYLVIYDGNNGYLGNKTNMMRKLYCAQNSKLPGYKTEYTEDEYTISSLGLAMRDGYRLEGWYISYEAVKDATGAYIYLDTKDGNGFYTFNENGDYVRGYVKDENGKYIKLSVEEKNIEEEDADGNITVGVDKSQKYIFIIGADRRTVTKIPADTSVESGSATTDIDTTDAGETSETTAPENTTAADESGEGTDTDTEGANETTSVTEGTESDTTTDTEEPKIDLPAGFYICNGQEDIDLILDENVKAAYAAAYARKSYSYSEISKYNGYIAYDDVSGEFAELFDELVRYKSSFRKAEASDKNYDHFSIVSEYVNPVDMMVENDNGKYVYINGAYVAYNPENTAHNGITRYEIGDRYIFNPTGEITSPSELEKYKVGYNFWDFANDRVTADVVDESGTLVLTALWAKKFAVNYHYQNETGQIDVQTKKLLEDNISYEDIAPGITIGRKEIVPEYSEHTFICWSKTPDVYDPWDFDNDVFPDDSNELNLYAYYLDGVYTRITSDKSLASIAKNLNGKYLLFADIDLGGKEYTTEMPTGMKENDVFTGEFVSFGKTISNYTIKAQAKKTQLTSTQQTVGGALFTNTAGAVINGVNIECNIIFNGLTNIGSGSDEFGIVPTVKMFGGGFIASAVSEYNEKTNLITVIKDCKADIKLTATNPAAFKQAGCKYQINVGSIVANESDAYKVENCTGTVDKGNMESVKGIVLNGFDK